MTKLLVGILVFPQVQQLDLTGPYEVFASAPDTEVRLVWKRVEPIDSATHLVLMPDLVFAECPQLDVLCVPGGVGVNALMEDEEVLTFLRRQAEGAATSLPCAAARWCWRRRGFSPGGGDHALGQPRPAGAAGRGAAAGPGGDRRQVHQRRWRHRRDRHGADHRRRAVRPRDSGGRPALPGVRAGAALRRRPARDGTAGGSGQGARARPIRPRRPRSRRAADWNASGLTALPHFAQPQAAARPRVTRCPGAAAGTCSPERPVRHDADYLTDEDRCQWRLFN